MHFERSQGALLGVHGASMLSHTKILSNFLCETLYISQYK